MSATHAQIANDMAAQAKLWTKRDPHVAEACLDCARVIRSMLGGEGVDGRTLYRIEDRLRLLEARYSARTDLTVGTSLFRGLMAVRELRAAQARAAT